MEQQERHSYSFIAYVPYTYSYRVMSLAVPGSRESPVVVVVFKYRSVYQLLIGEEVRELNNVDVLTGFLVGRLTRQAT